MDALRRWMRAATTEEQNALAEGAGTSRMYLYQLSTGGRKASAEIARAIELAAVPLHKDNPKLPELRREMIAPVCARCEYAKACAPKK